MFYLAYFDRETKKVFVCQNIKTLVFTCDTLGHGGAERVISSLSNQFSLKGINIAIIGVADNGKNEPFYNLNSGISYIPLCKEKKLKPFARIIALRRAFKSLNPDVIVSFLPNATIYSFLANFLLNIPLVVSERNDPRTDPKNKLTRLIKRIVFEKANGCVFQTLGAMNFYSNEISQKSIIIKNPLVLSYIPKECCKAKEKTVLAVGRLTVQKNYPCLFEAFKIFNEKHDRSFLLKVYGTGPLENELKELSISLKIDEYVRFMGNDSDWQKKEYMDSIFVLSSDYEGMPNSLIEAMALGIPSISTDCPSGGPKEIVEDGVNGFLVPVNDPDALAKKMIDIIELPPDSFYKSTRKMLVDYSVDTIAAQWLFFIQSLSNDIY